MGNLTESNGKARATLILDHKDASSQLQHKLKINGWFIHVANTFKDFKRLFQQHRFEVVIIYFHQDIATETSELETLATLNIITKWIAVIPSEDWLESHPSILFSHFFYDYHRQPLRYDHLLATIGHAYGMATLQHQKLKRFQVRHHHDDIIGHSKATEKIRERIAVVASEQTPVLINGNSGTGKQFIARILHQKSAARQDSFNSINCGATPEHLINSELFGHEKNSLHPQREQQIGKIERSDQGTLLLNDVEELPLAVQSSLVQFIEHNRFHRTGTTKPRTSHCRIIATTSVDIHHRVHKKHFREDLFHALSITTIDVPTLIERHRDIQSLAQYFLAHFCRQSEIKNFTQCAINAMQQYHWPGNVRELMNRIRRAIILSEGELINEAHLELPKNHSPASLTLKDARDKVEKDIVIRAIAQVGYNHSKAAKNLGISRASLYRLISKHQIPL